MIATGVVPGVDGLGPWEFDDGGDMMGPLTIDLTRSYGHGVYIPILGRNDGRHLNVSVFDCLGGI